MKKIGIWGFGVVGKSAADFFLSQHVELEVLDNRTLQPEEYAYLKTHAITWCPAAEIIAFLERNDCILPSPGIDLRPYAHYRHKWISELDLFAHHYTKPIIAITGTIGKTSITHLLSTIIKQAVPSLITGGNIGIPMLSLMHKAADLAVLEVSSFQLELSKQFAPDLAIWTNLYPNHLDRHPTLAAYIDAKYNLLTPQNPQQTALIPYSLLPEIMARGLPKSRIILFSPIELTLQQLAALPVGASVYYCTHETIMLRTHDTEIPLIALSKLPEISFIENWIIIVAALHIMGLDLNLIQQAPFTLPEHRLHKIATIDQIDFYNDSKSTTPVATLAALNKLCNKPIHLFLGGLSKGIDRKPFIKAIKDKVFHVYCFGKEAADLYHTCNEYGIHSSCFATLEQAFDACTDALRMGDQVLFSPAGSSYDLFENYEKRGERFKQLVRTMEQKRNNNDTSAQNLC